MKLPDHEKLDVGIISSIFNKTTATYKFYWFLSLLELLVEEQQPVVPIRNILSRMICNAWYPIHYYKLSFGFADMLSTHSKEIQKQGNIPIDIDKIELYPFSVIVNKDRRV